MRASIESVIMAVCGVTAGTAPWTKLVFLHVVDPIGELVIVDITWLGGSLVVEGPGQVIHLIPCERTLDRLFKVGTDEFCALDRLFETMADKRLFAVERESHGDRRTNHFTLQYMHFFIT